MRHDRDEVASAYASRQERLVSIPESGFCHSKRLLLAQCGRKASWTELKQSLTRTRGSFRREIDLGKLQLRLNDSRTIAVGLVDGYISKPRKDLGSAVLRAVRVD